MLDLSHDLHVILLGHLTAPRDSCRHHHLQTPKCRMGMGRAGLSQAFLFSGDPKSNSPSLSKGNNPRSREEWEPCTEGWNGFTQLPILLAASGGGGKGR